MLATLFAARGTLMLTAGDEFGRTQHGNNNAYAQDNPAFWLDWSGRDTELEDPGRGACRAAAANGRAGRARSPDRRALVVRRHCRMSNG